MRPSLPVHRSQIPFYVRRNQDCNAREEQLSEISRGDDECETRKGGPSWNSRGPERVSVLRCHSLSRSKTTEVNRTTFERERHRQKHHTKIYMSIRNRWSGFRNPGVFLCRIRGYRKGRSTGLATKCIKILDVYNPTWFQARRS